MFALTTLTTVNVTDILDPPPTFTESIYSAELIEGTYSNVSNSVRKQCEQCKQCK